MAELGAQDERYMYMYPLSYRLQYPRGTLTVRYRTRSAFLHPGRRFLISRSVGARPPLGGHTGKNTIFSYEAIADP